MYPFAVAVFLVVLAVIAVGACFGGNATLTTAAAHAVARGLLKWEEHPASSVRFFAIRPHLTPRSPVVVTAYPMHSEL